MCRMQYNLPRSVGMVPVRSRFRQVRLDLAFRDSELSYNPVLNAVRALPALGKLCVRYALAWLVDCGGRAGGEPPVLPATVPA